MHKKTPATKIFKKNAFEGYGNNIVMQGNRSQPEIAFENWCETCDRVEWYYKNGDKGDEYFCLVYRRTFRRNNFYPDYILKTKSGEIWIIEVKGGMSANEESENIDPSAVYKFEEMKKYGILHPEVHWGFVRGTASQLYLSNTKWDENLFNTKVWEPIEFFI